jgi:hypothetical protein
MPDSGLMLQNIHLLPSVLGMLLTQHSPFSLNVPCDETEFSGNLRPPKAGCNSAHFSAQNVL